LVKLLKILGEGRLFEEVISYPLAGFVGADGTGALLVIISSSLSIKKATLKSNKKKFGGCRLKKMLCL
jgi:hypothetical protein